MSAFKLAAGDLIARRLAALAGVLGLLLGVVAVCTIAPSQAATTDPSAPSSSSASADPSASASASVSADPSASASTSATASASASATSSAAAASTKVEAGDYPAYQPATAQSVKAGASDHLTVSKSVTRTYHPNGAAVAKTVSNNVTVTVNKHTNLQPRERIHIAWSGAHPTGGRAANPLGSNGLSQEYPVMIMECRGKDTSAAPVDEQVTPDTCWTTTSVERTVSGPSIIAPWQHDLYATAADKDQVSGVRPSRLPSDCAPILGDTQWRITPFIGHNGVLYTGCDSAHMPPESAGNSVDPPNEMAAFTTTNGTGVADFEVRTNSENESLGCSATVECTLEIIPIEGLSCADTDLICNQNGNYAPGSLADSSIGSARAVTPNYWWAPSNWRNRISVPLTFAPPPSVCQIGASGPAVPFYGSELLGQAALQWAPAYCLNKKRFNWQQNNMPDGAGFEQMESGAGVAAEVSARKQGDDDVAYAPTAVTGWGIAFNIDKPNNQGQQLTLKLNARLIAKLLSESYPASGMGKQRPGLEDNPYSMNLDPEFRKLNPGLDTVHFSEAASTLLTLSSSDPTDAMSNLTAYVDSDPEARAFLDGKKDPWGMKVNPAYKGIKLPVDSWPLLDGWTPKNTGNACVDANPAPYLQKVAAPVSSFRLISLAMLFNWPNVNTYCAMNFDTGAYQLGRIGQQGVGSRFMTGLVTLGDAARYGLTVASIESAPHHFVAPTDASMAAAVKLAKPGGPARPFAIPLKKLRESATAYPGTMVVYTAAKTQGLPADQAKQVSQFIDISSTEGQHPGRGNGELPEGYLPITKTGATGALYAAARKASALIAAQKGLGSSGGGTTAGGGSAGGVESGGSVALPPGVATGLAPGGAPAPTVASPGAVATSDGATSDVPLAKTAAVSSNLGGGMLPLLLAGGLAALLASLALRVALLVRRVR